MACKKKHIKLIVGLLIFLIVVPFVHAAAYGSGTYGIGDYGYGEAASALSGGGGGSGKSYECVLDSDCDQNQYCSDYKCYDSECSIDTQCNINEGEVCLNHLCVKLFDIKIVDFGPQINLGSEFQFTYFLKGMADINGDVEISFWLEKDGFVATSGRDVIYVGSYEEKNETSKLYMPTTAESGVYTFYVKLTHEKYSVSSHRTVEIVVDSESKTATIKGISDETEKLFGNFTVYLISFLVGLAVLLTTIIFYIERKKIKRLANIEKKFFKKYKTTFLSASLFIVLVVLAYVLSRIGIIPWSIKSFFVSAFYWIKNIVVSYIYYIIGLAVLIFSVILFRKKHLIGKLKPWLRKRRPRKKAKKAREKHKKHKKVKARAPKLEIPKFEKTNRFMSKISKHKTLFTVILALIIIIGIVAYLFYSGILTLAHLQNLWHSFTGRIINIIEQFAHFLRGLGKSLSALFTPLSSENNSFYPIMFSIIGFVFLVVLIIAVKKKKFLEKFGSWINEKRSQINFQLKKRRVERERNEAKHEKIEIRSLERRARKIRKFNEFIKGHKSLLIGILGAVILVGIVAYLFYSGILTLIQLQNLWQRFTDWIADAAKNLAHLLVDLWEIISIYFSLYFTTKNNYFYPALFSIIGMVFLVSFIVVAKKKKLLQKLDTWMKEKRNRKNEWLKERRNERKKVKEERGEHEKLTGAKFVKFEKTRVFLSKHKRLLSIILIAIILIGTIVSLFYYGILSYTETSQEISEGVSQFGKAVGDDILNLWNQIKPTLSESYEISVNWATKNYAYLVAGALVILIVVISYFKRKSLKKLFKRAPKNI